MKTFDTARDATLAATGLSCRTSSVRQGRCKPCRIVYYGKPGPAWRVSAMRCPECRRPLSRTAQPAQTGDRPALADHRHVTVMEGERTHRALDVIEDALADHVEGWALDGQEIDDARALLARLRAEAGE